VSDPDALRLLQEHVTQCRNHPQFKFHARINALEAVLLSCRGILKKYQARYHGAEHAQRDWETGEAVMQAIDAARKQP
jgi:hypothetical protein